MCCDTAENIKAKVIDWLLTCQKDILIGNEIMYGTSRKVVDLLAIIDNKAIAIEIKSASDKLNRLQDQLEEYYKVFDKVIIITSTSHLNSIKQIIPKGTGIYTISNGKIRKINAPFLNRNQSKLEILYTISSSFLKKQYPRYKALNEHEIRFLLSKKKKADIHTLLIDFYKYRLTEKYQLFVRERGEHTLIDDIPTLSTLTLIDEF